MKTKIGFVLALTTLLMSSCIVVTDEVHYGPNGRAGDAYFGIDYVYEPPMEYWDENRSVPDNPYLGEYYYTYPGTFYFEYFLDANDYWYGEYTVWVNGGEPGGANGRPGRDGADTYLMMVFDPDFGPDEFRKNNSTNLPYTVKLLEDGKVELTPKDGSSGWKIVAQKANVKERPSQKK